MVLPGHWPQAAHLPEQPLQGHLPTAQVLGQELPGFFREVEQDRPGFEQGQRLAAVGRGLVDNGRDAVVGGYFQKVRSKLFVLADIDRMNLVGQASFFKKQ